MAKEVIVGKLAREPEWRQQKSVVLKKYILDLYSEDILDKIMMGKASVFVNEEPVNDIRKRISPHDSVLITTILEE